MRNIISQVTALWDICRRERKAADPRLESKIEWNPLERTWRPWVSRLQFASV